MRLQLFLHYLAVGPCARALPLAAVDSTSSSDRTKINIIWTCLVTIFTCTWVAVHPNVPAPGTGGTFIALRRLRLMMIALVAPEAVIVWAMRQWIVARKIKHEHQAHNWTQAHGYFALMGGFMLFDGEVRSHTVRLEELGPLLQRGRISITKEEIKDKGRGDMLSKGIVIVQTGWFILQCVARRLEHLPIIELELVTLAFAALNFVTYGLWWQKPLDVQCPLRVYEGSVGTTTQYEAGSGKEAAQKNTDLLQFGVGDVIREISNAPAAIAKRITEGANFIRKDVPKKLRGLAKTLQNVIGEAVNYVRTHDILDILRSGVLAYLRVVWYPIGLVVRLGGAEADMKPTDDHVPTFYAGTLTEREEWVANFFGVVLATIFGAIHCIAWPFHFPSHAEQWLWRASSLATTCVPLVLFIFAKKGEKLPLPGWLSFLPVVIYCGGPYLYFYARIFLLILPFTALRSLPPAAYQDVYWTAFIPHV